MRRGDGAGGRAAKAGIMTTGLAGGLTKPCKGIRPAALTRPELPTHAPVPPRCCSKQLFALFASGFSQLVARLLEKGLTILGIAISSPDPRSKRGFSLHKKGPMEAPSHPLAANQPLFPVNLPIKMPGGLQMAPGHIQRAGYCPHNPWRTKST